MIRKAKANDISAVAEIYDAIHTAEESGMAVVGWVRGVYPTSSTAEAAVERGDLFVMTEDGAVVGAAIINQAQCDGYETGAWRYPADAHEVMVLHTLVIAPSAAGRGYGRAFVRYYEHYALAHGCPFLRMDTNERNARAREMYRALGYSEIGVIPTVFNGIEGVALVLLEKKLAGQESVASGEHERDDDNE